MAKAAKTSAKKSSKSKKEVPAKKVAAKKETRTVVEKSKLGASFFFDDAALKRLNAILKKEDLSFNAWANKLVKDKVK